MLTCAYCAPRTYIDLSKAFVASERFFRLPRNLLATLDETVWAFGSIEGRVDVEP